MPWWKHADHAPHWLPVDAWATAADLARLYAVSKQTVRRWASEDGWQVRKGRPCRYRWEDAQDSYEKRHTNRVQQHLLSRLTQ